MSEESTFSTPNPTRRALRLAGLSFVLAGGFILILSGASLIYDQYVATHGGSTGQGGIATAEQPSETKPHPTLVKEYTVPAGQPRSLRIASVGISGLIQPVGLTKTTAMAVPTNIYFAGWYTGSVRPGQPGLSIIDGHVSGRYVDGLFKNLAKVKPGAIIEVEFGDRTVKKFAVIDQRKLPDDRAAGYLFTKRANVPAQLNLITCGGTFNKTTGRYDDRVVVVARSIN